MKSRIAFCAAIAASVLAPAGLADDAPQGEVTFARDVAPIVFNHCARCHRPGEMAPMSLMSYAEVRPWAKSIKTSVGKREMPPWDADPAVGKWRNDISLSDAQIATIVKWVDSGAPEGNAADLPEAPKFTQGWQLGEPDYVIELDAVDVAAEGPDTFPNLTAKVSLPGDHWIQAVEVRPGDANVLHHVVVFGGAMGGGDAGLGGGGGVLAWWAAGTPPVQYPDGMGRELKRNITVTANMHYHPNGKATTDKTRIGLHFGEGELKKTIFPATAGDVAMRIKPGQADYETRVRYKFDQDVDVISFFPHMHMRGKDMKYTAHFPDGRSEVLLNVPAYDFNWQWFYYPEQNIRLPKGTSVEVLAHHDNSAGNPNNPDPTIELRFGEQSDEEMMFAVMEVIPVEGVRMKAPNMGARIEEWLAENPSDANYKINLNTGMMKVPAIVHLPKEGAAKLLFPFGGQMLALPLDELGWDGDAFSVRMHLPGARGEATLSGSVAADGTIKGDFDIKNVESVGPGPLKFVGFEGKRVASAAK